MARRWARAHAQRGCRCNECARLDLDFPGEGFQIPLPFPPMPAMIGGGVTMFDARLIDAVPEMLTLLRQYASDLRYPPADDSRERRLEALERLFARIEGAA